MATKKPRLRREVPVKMFLEYRIDIHATTLYLQYPRNGKPRRAWLQFDPDKLTTRNAADMLRTLADDFDRDQITGGAK